MERLKIRIFKNTAMSLFFILAVIGCSKEPLDISYQGLKTINELDNLEPTLIAVVDPDFFAPWINTGSMRQLTSEEYLALESKGSLLFRPDVKGDNVIASQFSLFTQRLRPRLEKWLVRSDDHMATVRKVFNKVNLPIELSYLPFIESGFSTRAISHAGAGGLWQFMPATGRQYGLACCKKVDERRDPVKSTRAAAAYLRMLHRRFGDWSLAIASYNAGENKIGRLVKMTGARDFFELVKQNDSIPYRYRLREETLLYVPRLIAIIKIMKNLEKLGFNLPKWYS